uniref:Uncharacterized protein n=1 Tax=Cannabis sativa TaxID=3483 RepID=A0A803RAC2_CANSA
MEECCGGDQFPGFQRYGHKDHDNIIVKRSLTLMSRLQRSAPCPLQIIKVSSGEANNNNDSQGNCSNATSSPSSSSSSLSSILYPSKDPIPLLSPLPSLLETAGIQHENASKSR